MVHVRNIHALDRRRSLGARGFRAIVRPYFDFIPCINFDGDERHVKASGGIGNDAFDLPVGPDLTDILPKGAAEDNESKTRLVGIDQRGRAIGYATIESIREGAAAQVKSPITSPECGVDIVVAFVSEGEDIDSWLDFHELGSIFAVVELAIGDILAPGIACCHIKAGVCN